MSSCIAAGLMGEMYELVEELQKEIDSLKHNTRADLSKIKEIQATCGKALWLKMKNVKSVSELLELEVKPTDMIGFMYNSLRKDLVEMMDKPMEIRQFQGLLVGNTPTQAMLEESRLVFHAFAAGNNMLREVMDIKVALLKKAEAEFELPRKTDNRRASRSPARQSRRLALKSRLPKRSTKTSRPTSSASSLRGARARLRTGSSGPRLFTPSFAVGVARDPFSFMCFRRKRSMRLRDAPTAYAYRLHRTTWPAS